jgi:hypothetical protein
VKRIAVFFAFGFLSFACVLPASALLNNYETLIVEPGDTYVASGTIYKSVSIYVEPGGTIKLPANVLADPSQWRLQLIAPWVKIEGKILAWENSYNTQGSGVPGNSAVGPGGSGFGGSGGQGHNHPGSGGPAYDTPYLENPGSMGVGNTNGGGGSIRVDALSLTLGAAAVLNANAHLLAATGGGGSGGCVLLNGVHTFLTSGSSLQAKGGDGQIQTLGTPTPTATSTPVGQSLTLTLTLTITVTKVPAPGGGGGAGGRLRLFRYSADAGFSDQSTKSVSNGAGGGGTAAAGDSGSQEVLVAPTPAIPQLLKPEDNKTVGLAPTFIFQSSDPMLSQFLQYEIEIAADTDPSFLSPVVKDSQLNPGPGNGWQNQSYFASNVAAAYYLPAPSPLVNMNTYYWRVKVTNDQGYSWSPYSAASKFTATNNNKPLKPRLLAPANNQIKVSKVPVLQILAADPDGDSITCSVTLSQDPHLFNPQIFQATYPGWDKTSYPSPYNYGGVTATCHILNTPAYPNALQLGATYFWKVTVYDQYQESNASDIGTFTVVSPPAVPQLLAPADQTVIITKNPELDLSSQSPTQGDLFYQLQLSSDDFQTIITFLTASSPGWTKTQYASGEMARLNIPAAYTLVPGKVYSWRASAYDQDNDNWSPTTDPFMFQVITPPLLPTLISPADGYTAPDAGLTYQFIAASESGNTLTYRCVLSADGFQSVFLAFDQTQSLTGWSSETYAPGMPATLTLPQSTPLERGKTYSWKVQASDGISWGPYSDSRSFSLASTLQIQQAKLYPNPAVSRDNLHCDLTLSVDAEVVLKIFNVLGQELKQYTFACRGGQTANQFQLDIHHFACGSYFCTIEAKSAYGNQKMTRKFVVVN